MSVIRRTAVIRADPRAVFRMISRVEDFIHYSPAIRGIEAIGPRTYRWRVNIGGIELDWDAVVTESQPPRRFAWRSSRGIENGGVFELEPVPEGTLLQLTMTYRLASPLLEKVVDIVAGPRMESIAAGILAHVRRQLEADAQRAPPSPSPPATR